jgi:hypothetical protein
VQHHDPKALRGRDSEAQSETLGFVMQRPQALRGRNSKVQRDALGLTHSLIIPEGTVQLMGQMTLFNAGAFCVALSGLITKSARCPRVPLCSTLGSAIPPFQGFTVNLFYFVIKQKPSTWTITIRAQEEFAQKESDHFGK